MAAAAVKDSKKRSAAIAMRQICTLPLDAPIAKILNCVTLVVADLGWVDLSLDVQPPA